MLREQNHRVYQPNKNNLHLTIFHPVSPGKLEGVWIVKPGHKFGLTIVQLTRVFLEYFLCLSSVMSSSLHIV